MNAVNSTESFAVCEYAHLHYTNVVFNLHQIARQTLKRLPLNNAGHMQYHDHCTSSNNADIIRDFFQTQQQFNNQPIQQLCTFISPTTR